MQNNSELRPRRQLEEGGHGGGKNVFEMALSGMDQMMIGWMMVAVVFSQLVLDEVLRRAEASVGTNARACLREVYKELSTVSTTVCPHVRLHPTSSPPPSLFPPPSLPPALPPYSFLPFPVIIPPHTIITHARNAMEPVEIV